MDRRSRRFLRLQEIGCLACRIEAALDGVPQVSEPSDVHHILEGGRRIGDHATVALCPYHHRGVRSNGAVGPSMACSPKAFSVRYGEQSTLLELTDELLDIYEDAGNDYGAALIEVARRVELYAVCGVLPESETNRLRR